MQLYLHVPFLILILLLFASYLKLLLHWNMNPLKSSMRVEIKFFQISADVDNVSSTHELWMFLIDLEWWILSRSFQIYLAHIHGRNHIYSSYNLTKIYLLNHKTWNQTYSLICRMVVVLEGMKLTLISLYISIRILRWAGVLSRNILEGIFSLFCSPPPPERYSRTG